jgi:catechol 2,3-dioxygenase-like lactoylglutathione lyase family enzyme
MPHFTRSSFVIAVRDLPTSAAFYRDVLGFDVKEVGDPGWLFFTRDGVTIMAGEYRNATPAAEIGDNSYFAYLYVTSIDAYHEAVVAAGTRLCKTLRDEPWGMREFGVMTVDGHRIMFGEARQA